MCSGQWRDCYKSRGWPLRAARGARRTIAISPICSLLRNARAGSAAVSRRQRATRRACGSSGALRVLRDRADNWVVGRDEHEAALRDLVDALLAEVVRGVLRARGGVSAGKGAAQWWARPHPGELLAELVVATSSACSVFDAVDSEFGRMTAGGRGRERWQTTRAGGPAGAALVENASPVELNVRSSTAVIFAPSDIGNELFT